MNSETLDKIRGHNDTRSLGIAGDVELRRIILDNEVSTGAELDRTALRLDDRNYPYTSGTIVRGKLASRRVLINYHIGTISTTESATQIRKRVYQLSNILSQAHKLEMKVLECYGSFQDSSYTATHTNEIRFAIVFLLPETSYSPPPSLAELLALGPRPSLSDRLRWTASLTTSILKMHLLG
jgi:hypothetical protein